MTASILPSPVSLTSASALPELENQPFSPEELYFFDDILDEVGLFMDVAMTQTPGNLPSAEAVESNAEIVSVSSTPSASRSSDLTSGENATPTPVTPSTSSTNLQRQTDGVPVPIPSLDQSKLEEIASIPIPETVSINKLAAPALPAAPKLSTKGKRRSVASTGAPSTKKRRLSATEGGPMTKQEEERRNRNREHAKRSRLRKKSLTQTLQQSVQELKQENEYLRKKISAKLGEAKTDSMVKERIVSPAERFIMALKKQGNTTLNTSTISYLKGLSETTRAKMQMNH